MSQLINKMSFYYGDEVIQFGISERLGSSHRVLIKVYPDCVVEAKAPLNTPSDEILTAVKKRARWIYKQLRQFRLQSAFVLPRQYVSGETHYYLGRQYMLKVLVVPHQTQYVKLLRGKLEVSVRQKSAEKVRELLNDWYRVRAKELFCKRLAAMLAQTRWVVIAPTLRILTMKTQWGSCSPQGRLTLNPHLVKASRESIDYVILHELCHLAEHNHSERFYKLMRQVMPNWEIVKERLDKMAAIFLNGDS